jgi:hypothetical protein
MHDVVQKRAKIVYGFFHKLKERNRRISDMSEFVFNIFIKVLMDPWQREEHCQKRNRTKWKAEHKT